jgi:glycosyltransferase involved in cell wall biosynthesis
MTTSLVSILLPVHNGAMYLSDAIKSILQQTVRNFEFVIINDCSTDESLDIINSFSDPRFLVINMDKKGGICKALNLGITQSRGRYIARMDADDICYPQRLQRQAEFLDHYQQIGFCGSWVKRFGENQLPQILSRPVSFQRIRAFSVFDNPMVHSSVMIRRDVLCKLTHWYKEEFAGAEDYEFWTRLMEITECRNLPEVLLDYRIHPQSVTLLKAKTMDSLACRIVKKELHKLGIIASDQEVLQHRLWSTGRLNKEDGGYNQIERAESWLKRLLTANLKSQEHDMHAFLWAIREIWYALCYQWQASGHHILHRFIQSSIGRSDIKHSCILAGALIKRRFC